MPRFASPSQMISILRGPLSSSKYNGHQLVEKMNDIGMLIDLSHASMRTMADTIAASNDPVIVSHSCCKALFEHNRNTTDENLRAIADKGGRHLCPVTAIWRVPPEKWH